MGFYDCRCMVTGVSLKGSDAVLVPLQQVGTPHDPIALAIKGTYNRLGSIDMIEEDDHTDLLLLFFLDQLRTAAFVVEQDYLRSHDCYPIRTIDHLLQAFERNINDDPKAAVLNGQPVVFALICRAVWEVVAQASPGRRKAGPALLRRLFPDSPVAEVYGSNLGAVSGHLHELSAIHALLADRGIPWRPPEDPYQHYAEEMQEYLEEARRTFRDSAVVSGGLKAYEQEVGDLLEEE